MFPTHQKEEFSVAFLHAVATVAGAKMTRSQVDEDSVDLTFIGDRGSEAASLPHLNVQAKCTETDNGRGDKLSFSLPIKNYDDLRAAKVHVPQILVVVCVPKRVDRWLKQTAAQMALRKCAYWLSLAGYPAVDNETNKTVYLPRTQTFTVEALQAMLRSISASGKLQ